MQASRNKQYGSEWNLPSECVEVFIADYVDGQAAVRRNSPGGRNWLGNNVSASASATLKITCN